MQPSIPQRDEDGYPLSAETRRSAASATPSCARDAAAQEVLTTGSMDHSEFWTKPSSLRLDVEGVDGLDVREFKIHDRLNELFSVVKWARSSGQLIRKSRREVHLLLVS